MIIPFLYFLLCTCLVGATVAGIKAMKFKGRFRFSVRTLGLVGAALTGLGSVGFLCTGLSSLGGLNWLPARFEWPVGFADNVIRTKSGFYVVPLNASKRIQIYDANWHFVSGLWVETVGKSLTLRRETGDSFLILTGVDAYRSDVTGRTSYLGASTEVGAGSSLFVPTPWPLMLLSSPGWSFVAAVVGIAILNIVEKSRNAGKKEKKFTSILSALCCCLAFLGPLASWHEC